MVEGTARTNDIHGLLLKKNFFHFLTLLKHFFFHFHFGVVFSIATILYVYLKSIWIISIVVIVCIQVRHRLCSSSAHISVRAKLN